MHKTYLLAAVLSATASVAAATTYTFNNMNAYCVSGGCTDLQGRRVHIANDLSAGAVYGLTEPTLVDGNGTPYAARVTIMATGGIPGSNHSSINVSPLNAWTHYRFEFVESFDIDTRTFGADLMVENIASLEIQDIDSNPHENFTDVAGVNLDIQSIGSALELGGFTSTTPNAPTDPDFNFVRLDQNGDGSWTNETNVPSSASQADKDSVSALFAVNGDLAGFEFIWGSTGPHADIKVRGWDLAINANTTFNDTPPVPLPASLPLLLAAVGGLAWTKRRRQAA